MKLIDIGAFNGDSALHFIAYPDIDSIDAYEPNPSFEGIWRAITRRYPTIKFYESAVYTKNGEVRYTQRPDNLPLGSTIMDTKSGWGMGEVKNIRCVDILDIVPNEPFCMKMDAEGAEYDILERLIESGKSNFIDRLYIEWHDSKMTSDNKQKQIDMTNHFGDRIKQWL